MRFRLTDLKLPAAVYAIYIFQTGLTEREFLAICSKLRYYATQDGVSWLGIYSTTESGSVQNKPLRNGKRGRPKRRICGKKTSPHCHLTLVGNKAKSAYSTAIKFKKAFDKKYHKPISRIISKGNSIDARIWIGYCLKQADIIRSGGDFDFAEHQIIL